MKLGLIQLSLLQLAAKRKMKGKRKAYLSRRRSMLSIKYNPKK